MIPSQYIENRTDRYRTEKYVNEEKQKLDLYHPEKERKKEIKNPV